MTNRPTYRNAHSTIMKHLLNQERWKDFIDVLSIIAPIICLFDCIVLPAMAILLPFVSVKQIMHGISDQMIALIVLGICMTAILPGFLRHRNRRVLILFGSGISLLFFVSFAGERLDQAVHVAMTLAVSFLLIKANLENKKLLACSCHHHHH
ncbi:MerC family mercury resistance protein [bacterium]|nr:MerC family mercury resistance protein [bacterium]